MSLVDFSSGVVKAKQLSAATRREGESFGSLERQKSRFMHLKDHASPKLLFDSSGRSVFANFTEG
jgi:hypothetical protein